MGIGASKERTFGISKENHLLYSPKLLDLEHGTIRHRDKELVEVGREEEVRQGYFYHAQLTDWTDDDSIKDFQKKVVVQGSKKEGDSKLFYIYAKGLESDTVDQGIVKVKPKPKGLGYRWRGDSEHRYFRLRLSKLRENEDSDSETEEVQGYDTVYRIHPKPKMTASALSHILSLKLLIPAERIHIIYKTQKLWTESSLEQLSAYYDKSKLELKILTDVEIVKNNYDADEPPPEPKKTLPRDSSNDHVTTDNIDQESVKATAPPRDVISPWMPPYDVASREVISPIYDATTIPRDVISPTYGATSPYGDVISPTRDVTSPSRDVISPTRDVTSPSRNVTTPPRDVISSTRDVISPSRDVTSPPRDVTSPSIILDNKYNPNKGELSRENSNVDRLPGAVDD